MLQSVQSVGNLGLHRFLREEAPIRGRQ
jgi:hypothetical protein